MLPSDESLTGIELVTASYAPQRYKQLPGYKSQRVPSVERIELLEHSIVFKRKEKIKIPCILLENAF